MKNLLFAMLAFPLALNAATIAVIDSGLDHKHTGMAGNIWVNPNERDDGRDNDGNSYQDDFWGWNFANGNNQVIDYKYLGTFSPDCMKYFEVQGRALMGTASEADIAWMRGKLADRKFVAEMGKFGNFIHGTHVAGIAVRGSQNQAMGVKLIPTEVGATLRRLRNAAKASMADDVRMNLLKGVLSALAQQQMGLMEEIALYVNGHRAPVANGSFGTGYKQAKTITDTAFKIAFFRDAKPEESDMLVRHFMNELLTNGQKMMRAAPGTLFVFAAGNDNSDNDRFPTSPTNIKADNAISVAATYDVQFLAPFSNYGASMVDVAAPGMLIDSAIPGNMTMAVSGTSQAAPYVARVAGMVKDANPALGPAEIKRVLMGTVDTKDYLVGKVSTAGIVNPARAVMAGELSKSMGLGEALSRARGSVRDVPPSGTRVQGADKVVPLPLFPLFE